MPAGTRWARRRPRWTSLRASTSRGSGSRRWTRCSIAASTDLPPHVNEIRHGRTRLKQAAELLGSILSQDRSPADRIMDQYFRERRQMGSKDRAFAAETVYGCLRRKAELEALAAPVPSTTLAGDALVQWLVATYLLKYSGW